MVFTASHQCYANVVLNYLDPERKWIHHRLFREHCVQSSEGQHVKDLRIFENRDLTDIILVDNAGYSFGYQINNGIPIIPFYNNKKDKELRQLIPFLMALKGADIQKTIAQTFKFGLIRENEAKEQVRRKILA